MKPQIRNYIVVIVIPKLIFVPLSGLVVVRSSVSKLIYALICGETTSPMMILLVELLRPAGSDELFRLERILVFAFISLTPPPLPWIHSFGVGGVVMIDIVPPEESYADRLTHSFLLDLTT